MPLLYPLKLSPLFIIIISTFTIWLALVNIVIFLLGLLLFTTFIPALAKYLFVILDHTANGFAEPPQLELKCFQPYSEWRHFKLMLTLAICFYSVDWLLLHQFNVIATIVGGYSLVVVPAIIGLLTMGDHILIALNPLAQIKFIKTIGLQYWLMFITIAVIGVIIVDTFKSNKFIAIFICLYTAVLVFHWLGKLIYQQRVIFDYHPRNSPERKKAKLDAELDNQREHHLYRAYREAEAERAIKVIVDYIAKEPDQLAAYQWFYQELKLRDKNKLTKAFGVAYASALKLQGKTARAEMITEQIQSL